MRGHRLSPAVSGPTVMVVFGTRPEAMKLAPIVRLLRDHPNLGGFVLSTGQHRELLDQVLEGMDIAADLDLRLMRPSQTLEDLTGRITAGVGEVLDRVRPTCVLVQGDTTTAFAAALAAGYHRVPVGHVEAGLRSGNHDDPFPEEQNRKLVTQLARWHFAPTMASAANLHREGIADAAVTVTGNTGIDNLRWVRSSKRGTSAFRSDAPRILVTLHRRENQAHALGRIATAMLDLAGRGYEVVLPVHPSPAVRDALLPLLAGTAVTVIEPLDPFDFARSLDDCDLVITDSGGVQEEAPYFGKPVLVARETTERPEGVDLGAARLVGSDPRLIVDLCVQLVSDAGCYAAMSRAGSPYGDGHAAERVLDVLERDLVGQAETQGVA